MNNIDFNFWFGLLQWLFTLALAVTVWLRKPGEDAGKAVEALRTDYTNRSQAVDTHLATIDERLRHMPNSEELAELEGTVKAISEKVSGISVGMERQTTQLDRIENFLLNVRKP